MKINLGCGKRKLNGFLNCDNRKEVNPDLVCDVADGLPFEDSSIEEVKAIDFLEHIPLGKTIGVIEDIWRVLIPGGIFESFTPDAEYGQGAFQDPMHLSFWVENSWKYFSEAMSRELYDIKANFRIAFLKRINDDSMGRIFHLHVLAIAIKG